MPSTFFMLFSQVPAIPEYRPPPHQDDAEEIIGLLSTPELDTVLAQCKSDVARIARQCRAKNTKFRDFDFDLENDQDRCLNGLNVSDVFNPSDVRRITDLFEKPQFFVGGPYSNEIIQGQKCSNCWFISALAATSTVKGLVELFCVARDEQVGVYGFIFWRDMRWVSIIIDDLLYTAVPKFEELSLAEKQLFQNDKEKYNASARKGSKSLYFAKSGIVGETWVPLIEKAYAKLHGDYGSLCGGYASEGTEDLTGGVSSFIQCKDILDKDKFWTEELLKANRDRIFACSFHGLNPTRNGNFNATINGLWGNHSYSVLKTLEYKGRRFLVIRNPCGLAEWTGPWSDGSKEWTSEWMGALPLLGHIFGDTGKFIMEYDDFLACFEQIDRTRLFDSLWTMKYDWLRVPPRPFPGSPLGYGDLCFSFSLSKATFTIVVLSHLDERFYKGLVPPCHWNFDFLLYKKGQTEPIGSSSHSRFVSRSVNLELELEEGEYVVHCRLDRVPFSDKTLNTGEWSQSKLARVLAQKAISESVASNFQPDFQAKNLPIPLEILAGQDLVEIGHKALALKEAKDDKKSKAKEVQSANSPPDAIPNNQDADYTTTITTITTVRGPSKITTNTKEVVLFGPQPPDSDDDKTARDDDASGDSETSRPSSPSSIHRSITPDQDLPFLGLRVYTARTVSVCVTGQLRRDMKASFEGLTAADWKSLCI